MKENKVANLVVTTPGENLNNSVNINYHTLYSDTYLEYTKEVDTLFNYSIKIKPQQKLWDIKNETNANSLDSFYNVSRYVCSISLSNLEAGTNFIYRIRSKDEYSDIFHFKTTNNETDFSFIACADFQYGNNPISHDLIKMLKQKANNANLLVCSGDMSDVGGSEDELSWFLDHENFNNIIYASAPGDHEYWSSYIDRKAKQFSEPVVYNVVFNNPKNGCDASLNSNFYFYYNSVLFIALDMGDSNTVTSPKISEEIEWFKTTLDKLKETYQYLVILEHKSLYGSYINDSRVHTTLRPQWDTLFDKYHVDLVISGHDHMYARTYKLYNGMRAKEDEDGTYYLDLGSSGNKARIPDDALYNDGLHECVLDLKTSCMACGAIINVSKEKMAVIIYNNEGKVVDNFIINNRKDMTI